MPKMRCLTTDLRSTRELQAIHKQCTRKLADLGLDTLTTVEDIRARASELSERDIQLVPYALSGSGVHGLLVRTDATDYVVYDSDTTTMHREHIILHELSHVMCGHTGASSRELAEILCRESYLDDQEVEAEMLASMMGQRVSPDSHRPIPVTNANLRRILASLVLEGSPAAP
ncbi:hypothetical protein DE4585_02746 [Mycobacteroides salmoniphilum]|uniref:Uncharacterized protein n=1 Tax=Mycobacteroides salmoniphilum TaxID=404941 RepID=A0A4R8SJV4_9MYCO|nr:ImmA/IrrE family metallo-endopeptidase [Mycobacteroides salmoniphilum]QCH22783.1 hypothetical protein DSM43276_01028 [Mycobacteroides salmoniphilum]TDZ79012.1 hypothetical protein DE4585_02746 [Mycobacteroides salmoniphilum]TDZ81096.1 hypothetical protein DE4586_01042 [Mycobacteroides salmoniphilum]TDZ88596.1 hypothetical protein DE4587_00958 [Mycobacteroides salmoniphilum]TDZ97521.1 hypothetical protein CCUG60885_01069 [Mycobacteroides salmoniphilum]